MTDRIRELLVQRPFIPFRLNLTGGSTYDVVYPEPTEVERGVLRCFRPSRTAPTGREWLGTVALAHVVSVETVEHEYPIVVEHVPG